VTYFLGHPVWLDCKGLVFGWLLGVLRYL